MHADFRKATCAYSIACAGLVLLMFPRFVASFGVIRQHPLELRARPDVVAVSFGDGAWMPSRGIAAARLIDGIPPGMRINYRLSGGEIRSGVVRNAAEQPSRSAARATMAILALTFALTGAVLAWIGIDRRAMAAAGMLAGFGLLFGTDFLEPALVAVRSLSLQLALIAAWEWFPCYAGLLCMLIFAREFPATLRRSRITTVLIASVAALVVSSTLINGIAHIPGLLDRTSLRVQSAVVALILLNQKLVYAGAALGVIVLAILQWKLAAERPAQLRKRARMVAGAILLGFALPMTLTVLQVVLNLTLGRRPIPVLLISTSFLTLLAIPAAVMTAVMAKRIDSFRIVARRALLFAVADRVFPLLEATPLVAIVLLLHANRQHSIESVVEEHPIEIGVMVAASVVLFVFGDRMRRAVRTWFRRDETATRERLASLPTLLARTQTLDAAAHTLKEEMDAAFSPETSLLLVHDERENMFRGIHHDVPRVNAASDIVTQLERAHRPLTTADLTQNELDELDRHWLAIVRAELLVPLFGSDQRLLGILTIGEKASELPFDETDKSMLMTIASACALTIENQRLRGQSPVLPAARPGHDDPALLCPGCERYFSSAAVSRCPVDDSELLTADVPYVLVGKYRFERRLGAGGMGVVYRVRDLELERDVAIKTLPLLSAETASFLRREARTAAKLVHKNLATVFAVESWRGVPMLILEYLDDGTLADRLACAPLPIESIVDCGCAIADALGHVHERTILHRDVKPSNIGFSRGTGAKLLDFGLARLFQDANFPVEILPMPQHLTVTSGIVGTPAYLSPEAILGESPHPDFDLWSLSLTLYQATTGTNPFMERSVTATMNAILTRNVPDPRELRGDCPEALSRFLVESLNRRREKRPRSAYELASKLRAVVAH